MLVCPHYLYGIFVLRAQLAANPVFSGGDAAATEQLQDQLWKDFSKKLEDGLIDAENNMLTYNADVTGAFEVGCTFIVLLFRLYFKLKLCFSHSGATERLVADCWLSFHDFLNECVGKSCLCCACT
jgi:hypothetical protein